MEHNEEHGDIIEMSQTIGDNFSGTKEINIGSNGPEGDVQATLEFVEHIYNYLPELGFATIYGLVVYAAVLWTSRTINNKSCNCKDCDCCK